jgi:uncharacterized integral membrane protein (TIGR00697 family)
MKSKFSFTLFVLGALFCVSLIVSNIIAGKLWSFPLGLTLTAGVVLFPIVYIIGDVVPEVYGFKVAQKIIFLGFILNLYAVIFFWITLKMVAPPFFQGQAAFETVLGFTPRLLGASFTAYLVGTHVNAWVLVKVKALTKSRFLWLRTISSTIVGEGLDSIIFISLAFYGIVPSAALPMMIVAQATFKILYEVIATPLTYLVVGWVKKQEAKNEEWGASPVERAIRSMPLTKE